MNISLGKIANDIFKILVGVGYQVENFDAEGNGPISEPSLSKYIFAKKDTDSEIHSLMIVMPEDDSMNLSIYKDNKIGEETFVDLLHRIKGKLRRFGVGITIREFAKDIKKKDFVHRVKANKEMEQESISENSDMDNYIQLCKKINKIIK